MGGNAKLQAHRRQVKAAAKARDRKGKHMEKKNLPSDAKPKSLDALKITEAMFPDDQMVWWIAHGVNNILSDYDNGVWSPMFEGIYEGHLPVLGEITQAILSKYNAPDAAGIDHWPLEAKSALAWAVSDRNVVYVYYREAHRRLMAAHGGDADIEAMARAPHNPLVWALFNYMKQQTLNHKNQKKHA